MCSSSWSCPTAPTTSRIHKTTRMSSAAGIVRAVGLVKEYPKPGSKTERFLAVSLAVAAALSGPVVAAH
jgi:hypothetical protein